MKYDYEFFEESLNRLRRLRSNTLGSGYLLDAPEQLFPEQSFGIVPKLLEEDEDHWGRVVLARSYARKPGKGLAKLEALMQSRLPDDFLEFHRLYDEALLTTRTYPIHLWSEEKILEEIGGWRDPYPIRFFRFAQYWDIYGLYYGLWQETEGGEDLRVVIVSHTERDDDLDDAVESEYILA